MRSILHALLVLVLVLGNASGAFAQADERLFYAGVVDKNGQPVLDLTEKDFIIREDGQAREILRVTRDKDPLQVALLVDNSAAMQTNISDLRRAVVAFVNNTREGVDIALITLGERPTIAVPYTANHDALKRAAEKLFALPQAGNYLLDAIAETSRGLNPDTPSRGTATTGRRAIIAVITGTSDISYRDYSETLRLFHDGGASLHVLTLGMTPMPNARDVRTPNIDDPMNREIVVGRATDETGGRNDIALASNSLEPKAAQMAAEISSQYKIAYARPQRLIPPKAVDIDVKNPDLRARGMLMKTEKER